MLGFINKLDRRWIYLLLVLVVLYPLVKPIGMPISVSDWTEAFYAEIEKLQPGDVVVLGIDYTPSGGPDVHPQVVALFDHLMKKNVKVVGISFIDTGPPQLQEILDTYMVEGKGKTYGVDFVNLGYLPGLETAIAAFASDMKRAAPVDFFNTKVENIPMMQNINSMHDVRVVADFATGIPGPAEWIRQVGQNYPVTMLAGVVTVMGPQSEPYYQSGQLKGLLSGTRSAAEYEVRSGSPGKAAAGMDAQSLGHLVIIFAIGLGNLAYFLNGRKGGGKK